MEQEETVWGFTYLGDRVSASGGCEATVTAITRCWWVIFKDCDELLYGRRFHLRLKEADHRSCVRPATLYGSEAWSLKERWEFHKEHKVHGESNVWSTAQGKKKFIKKI